ncbi:MULTISPECIES: hypothetical protein [unclassified Mesorhizobium]|uniref:hypothetical protein n=1 Tax=unclassified Mesorhizobium TaxID=325217 RepID=UPI001CCF876C|nr:MULTISPECIES: hypothetical protein [unclassified Mesorhizobium]MBZ9739683.1 hypothetical protein [Mesorhizobium sp. CO1-1-4]MBZ9805053.1 hypothetical protein [Mesorhizobium sp. ES1-6]
MHDLIAFFQTNAALVIGNPVAFATFCCSEAEDLSPVDTFLPSASRTWKAASPGAMKKSKR